MQFAVDGENVDRCEFVRDDLRRSQDRIDEVHVVGAADPSQVGADTIGRALGVAGRTGQAFLCEQDGAVDRVTFFACITGKCLNVFGKKFRRQRLRIGLCKKSVPRHRRNDAHDCGDTK